MIFCRRKKRMRDSTKRTNFKMIIKNRNSIKFATNRQVWTWPRERLCAKIEPIPTWILARTNKSDESNWTAAHRVPSARAPNRLTRLPCLWRSRSLRKRSVFVAPKIECRPTDRSNCARPTQLEVVEWAEALLWHLARSEQQSKCAETILTIRHRSAALRCSIRFGRSERPSKAANERPPLRHQRFALDWL